MDDKTAMSAGLVSGLYLYIKMDNEIKLISYYRDLLIRAVPETSSSISHCVLKGWLHRLGNSLGMAAIRVYLYDDRTNNVLIHHIYGDRNLWRDVDITKFRREKTKYKKLFFIKIRHIRENGQFAVLGYLSFHTESFVTEELISSLDVLCMLYGNYITKRLVAGHAARMNNLLPKAYAIAANEGLPGTKIQKLLESLHNLAGFNYGVFCTVNDKMLVPEYLATNKSCSILRKHIPWSVPDIIIENLKDTSQDHWYNLSDMPQKIIQFILFNDNRNPEDFSLQVYPIIVDGELIGLWMFVFSEGNLFDDFNATGVLNGTFSLLRDSYRFLFQRRFEIMIVNPIFQNRDTRVNSDTVFVIMPFTQEWSKDVWEQVIRPSVQEIGMTPIRADDLYGQNIMEDVWQSILKAAIIICDTTGRNPNVFYELGIAHTLGKKVLLLTQSIDDIPFDLQAYRHIEYKVTISGGNELKETIKRHIRETLHS